MTLLDMAINTVVSKVSFAIREPSMEELIRSVNDSLRLLEPMDIFCLLSPKFIHVLNRSLVHSCLLIIDKSGLMIVSVEYISRFFFAFYN